ncbi:MAG TPA: polyphosphate kinase 2 family protein [Chthoniobacterales bacterium]
MFQLGEHLSKTSGFDLKSLMVEPGRKISLKKDFDPGYCGEYRDKDHGLAAMEDNVKKLASFQDTLYASKTYSLLLIFQALDAAGKDGTIKHVMSGVNPQGCDVRSFKAPSPEELAHDFLWRAIKVLPERGRIGIFNRSYYEEVLAVRVHPELIEAQHLPSNGSGGSIWRRRYEEINHFERYLVDNGCIVLKFFLNVSKKEQKKRFLARIDDPQKNWKFSASDIRERKFWDDYMDAFETAFRHTSTKAAPWFVIPADHKWFTRLAVSEIIVQTMKGLALAYPKATPQQMADVQKAKGELLGEDAEMPKAE